MEHKHKQKRGTVWMRHREKPCVDVTRAEATEVIAQLLDDKVEFSCAVPMDSALSRPHGSPKLDFILVPQGGKNEFWKSVEKVIPIEDD